MDDLRDIECSIGEVDLALDRLGPPGGSYVMHRFVLGEVHENAVKLFGDAVAAHATLVGKKRVGEAVSGGDFHMDGARLVVQTASDTYKLTPEPIAQRVGELLAEIVREHHVAVDEIVYLKPKTEELHRFWTDRKLESTL